MMVIKKRNLALGIDAQAVVICLEGQIYQLSFIDRLLCGFAAGKEEHSENMLAERDP